MSQHGHLNSAATALLQAPLDERLHHVRQLHYFEYPAAENSLRELQDLVNYPLTTRPPCRALIADSNNGKTTLTMEFMRRNPTTLDAAGCPHSPVVWMEAPPEPDEGRFYSAMLTSLSVTHRADAKRERLQVMADEELINRRAKLLVIDEFHAMLNGTSRQQKEYMSCIKRFVNVRQLSLVVAGTIDVTRALATDMQFVTRFQKIALPRWNANLEFLQLLTSFESTIPLPKPSRLAGEEMAFLIFQNCQNTIGGVRDIVTAAAELALNDGQERITYKLLKDVCEKLGKRRLH
jgi:hypothetical protein